MNDIKAEARQFADELKEWVGNSPWKATAFGLMCAVIGYLMNFWPL